ncbi:hypothetical protein SAMN05216223_117128 [Actinacidiphila yanglinensis]|uniref:Transcriptional regulator, AbiEi antitoxin, Type IV TA system n=1 Tax=Actinacidiphila yanglinensis TaxID=310779 RepID=A0A1H6DMS3_9ACTN|nr:hypothetical protein [Actinacidiphila yanglinensis]SEG86572.1 hypothetical protein SAMN05216223_117128 [Actinacidiphila yanglinensis]
MNANDLTPHAPDHIDDCDETVLTVRRLRELGLSAAEIAARCRPGGNWQQILPQVCLLHSGPPSSEERVRAALLYAGREPDAHGPVGGGREAMVTGLAALALYRFSAVPPLIGLPAIDVLVPWQRRLRDAGEVRVHRARELPLARNVSGLPCAPVPRAVADAVAELGDTDAVRALLTEAVRSGHCEGAAVLRELSRAGLLDRPQVRRAVDVLRAEDRAMAEQRLYVMVHCHQLPDPVWNVDLRLPGGPPLGGVDAFWPEHGVAVCLDPADDALWPHCARQREHLEALGVTVVFVSPVKLRDAMEQQAAVIRTALIASCDREPAAYLVVTPR